MGEVSFEMPLKHDQPMIMSDDDFDHLKIMFNAGQSSFKSNMEAMSIAESACYLTDLHIDLLNPRTFSTHVKAYDEFSYYVEYNTYNARTHGMYDVKLRLGKHPDGTYTVMLVRPNEKVPR